MAWIFLFFIRIQVIIDKKKVTADELSKAFDVSIRTIQRDIDTLCSSGIPIYGEVGKYGGYHITENYKLDKNYISQNEINTLLEILNSFKNTLFKDSVRDLLNKFSILNTTKPANNKLLIDSSPWGNTIRRNKKLDNIYKAVEENRYISFEYTDLNKKHTNRIVEPYTIIMKGISWYLYAYCTSRNDYRLFNINRINNLYVNDSFPERLDFKPFNNSIIDSPKQSAEIIIKTKLTSCVPDYLNPLEEKIYDKNFKIIKCVLPIDEWLYTVLLGMSNDYEILKPDDLRVEITDRIKKSLKNYDL